MPWELTVLSPTGSLRSKTDNDTYYNPVMSVDASVDAGGRTNSINIRARNSHLSALPRSIIEYSAWSELTLTHEGRILTFDGADLFTRDIREPIAAGVVVTCPPLLAPGAGPADRDADALERVTAVGLEHLLTERIVKPRSWEGDLDVATIAYQLAQEFGHPRIIVNAANFPPTGHVLGLFYTPEKTVSEALDDLITTLPSGGRWYIDAKREIHFIGGA